MRHFNKSWKSRLQRGWPWVMVVVVVSTISTTAYAISCFWWELWELEDANVTLIDGDGDVSQERARWNDLTFRQFDGPDELVVGGETFVLERAP